MDLLIAIGDLWRRQDGWTEAWHTADPVPEIHGDLLKLAMDNHRANFELWHEEDKARDPRSTDAEIAAVKRAIDRINQGRNDLVEKIDELLLAQSPASTAGVPLHSETPGMMIDRLSILALKIFHMREQTERADVDAEHRRKSLQRLGTLGEQRLDLAASLLELWAEVLAGGRRFKIYRQVKMYNDPTLNPAIYGSGKRKQQS